MNRRKPHPLATSPLDEDADAPGPLGVSASWASGFAKKSTAAAPSPTRALRSPSAEPGVADLGPGEDADFTPACRDAPPVPVPTAPVGRACFDTGVRAPTKKNVGVAKRRI